MQICGLKFTRLRDGFSIGFINREKCLIPVEFHSRSNADAIIVGQKSVGHIDHHGLGFTARESNKRPHSLPVAVGVDDLERRRCWRLNRRILQDCLVQRRVCWKDPAHQK